MKCTKVEKLLPLYVGNDLTDEASERSIAEHLNACVECRRTLDEFRASHDVLRNISAPAFDDAFYQDLRSDVLREIRTHRAPRPSIFESLRLAFVSRPAFAATLALLMVFIALSVVVRRNLTVNSGHLASVESGFGEINPHELRESKDVSQSDAALPPRRSVTEMVRLPRSTASLTAAQRKKQSVEEEEGARPEDSATAARNEPAPPVAPDVPRNDSAIANHAQPAQAIARMEIQTSDPNIRIIWLGKKPSE